MSLPFLACPRRNSLLAAACVMAWLAILAAPLDFAQFGLPHRHKKQSPATQPDSSTAPDSMPNMPNMPNTLPPNGAADRGGPAVNPPGVPVEKDSPVYAAFTRLQQQASYHTTMRLVSTDPRMAQAAASGFGVKSIETFVKGDVHKATMHLGMPATDLPGTVDDWEASGIVANGKRARLLYSPTATPRILAKDDQQAVQELAMIDEMTANSVMRQASQGPMGAAVAGWSVGMDVMMHVEAARTLKKAHDFFTWQCEAAPASSTAESAPPELTDLNTLGDETISGTAVTKYEFYVHENGKFMGPVRLSVAKNSGLPYRLELNDAGGRGSVTIDYDTATPVNIDVPACMK
jgi:hypothetical protein